MKLEEAARRIRIPVPEHSRSSQTSQWAHSLTPVGRSMLLWAGVGLLLVAVFYLFVGSQVAETVGVALLLVSGGLFGLALRDRQASPKTGR